MAHIQPFKAVRFNTQKFYDVSKLISPPYDIINPEQRKQLEKQNLYNIVRIELPRATGSMNCYQHAKMLYRQWLKQGVLVQDEQEAVYVYEQRFTVEAHRYVRRGFFAAVKLEKPHAGSIVPHEKTLPKPKKDRFNLMKAVQANISPVFGFFPDGRGKVRTMLAAATRQKPVLNLRDADGIQHKVYQLDNKKNISMLRANFNNKKIFIADGHHRYETAWHYLQYMRNRDVSGVDARYALIFLCPLEDQGLVVLPTHRVVPLNADFPEQELMQRAAQYFSVKIVKTSKQLINTMPHIRRKHGIGLCIGKKQFLLILKNLSPLIRKFPTRSSLYRKLDVVILHTLLLRGIDPQDITYVKKAEEACQRARMNGVASFLVNAPTVQEIQRISALGESMPQKTTYFYPKLATGLVIHSLTAGARGKGTGYRKKKKEMFKYEYC